MNAHPSHSTAFLPARISHTHTHWTIELRAHTFRNCCAISAPPRCAFFGRRLFMFVPLHEHTRRGVSRVLYCLPFKYQHTHTHSTHAEFPLCVCVCHASVRRAEVHQFGKVCVCAMRAALGVNDKPFKRCGAAAKMPVEHYCTHTHTRT